MEYLIGLDIGTSSAKALAINFNGKLIARYQKKYPVESPKPGFAEQDPELIFQAIIECLNQVTHVELGELTGVCISCAMHSLIGVDKMGRPLTKIITWADNRSALQAQTLKKWPIGRSIYQHTGTPIHAMSPLSKIKWLGEEQPGVFQKVAKFVGIKEYLLFRLFGCWVSDYSIASATGLFDIHKLQWFGPALDYLDLSKDKLPSLVPTNFMLRGLSKSWTDILGIEEQTPFIIGASDGCLANLGVLALEPDTLALTIGTSAAARFTNLEPLNDEKGRLFNYVLEEGQYVIGGASNNGGIVWEWITKQYFQDQPMEAIFQELQAKTSSTEGLLYLPWLLGERAPIWDATATSAFLGVKRQHTKEHFTRAVLEGIIYNIYQICAIIEQCSIQKIETIIANGGFVRSSFWVQMVADIFGKQVSVYQIEDSSALGAVMMGMKALGIIEAYQDLLSWRQLSESYQPKEGRHQSYQAYYQIFSRLYDKLGPELSALGKLNNPKK